MLIVLTNVFVKFPASPSKQTIITLAQYLHKFSPLYTLSWWSIRRILRRRFSNEQVTYRQMRCDDFCQWLEGLWKVPMAMMMMMMMMTTTTTTMINRIRGWK